MASYFERRESDENKLSNYAFDAFHRALTTIDSEHRLIHDGMYFSFNASFSALAASGTFDLVFEVPAGTFPHLRSWNYSLSDGPCRLDLWEGVTASEDGTVITPTNNNRNSSNTAGTVVRQDPTISANGESLLEDVYVPDPGGGFFTSPGTAAADLSEEWVLRPSTKYALRLTNNAGGPLTGSVYVVFYELQYADNPRVQRT